MVAGSDIHALDGPLPQAQLVQEALEGDSEAFVKLYEAYVTRVYRFVFFRVSDRQTAEDLTSQTFLKAWDHLEQCQARDVPFGAWLFRIARNTVIDYYRSRRHTSPLDIDPAAQDGLSDALDELEKREETEGVRRALQGLTDEQREVLTLKFIDGLTTNEAAQVMGKRPGAIRALQMRGLQSLAAILTGKDYPGA